MIDNTRKVISFVSFKRERERETNRKGERMRERYRGDS